MSPSFARHYRAVPRKLEGEPVLDRDSYRDGTQGMDGERGYCRTSWRLLRGDELLGTPTFAELKIFATDCRFSPTPAFETIRPLFEAELAAGGDLATPEEIEDWERAWAAVDALGLTLDPQDGSPLLRTDEFILHIWPGGAARLRL